MSFLLQVLVPLQLPAPPRLFFQLTEDTATASEAVPPILSWDWLVEWVEPLVGFVIVTVGFVVSGGV